MTAKSIAFGLALAFAGVGGASASEALFNVVDVDVTGMVDNSLSFEAAEFADRRLQRFFCRAQCASPHQRGVVGGKYRLRFHVSAL